MNERTNGLKTNNDYSDMDINIAEGRTTQNPTSLSQDDRRRGVSRQYRIGR